MYFSKPHRPVAIASSLASLSMAVCSAAQSKPDLKLEVSPASINQSTVTNPVVTFLKENSPVEIFATLISVSMLTLAARYGVLRLKSRLDKGEAFDYFLAQHNLVDTDRHGNNTLLIRNVISSNWIADILKYPPLVNALEKLAKKAHIDDGLIPLDGVDGRHIQRLVKNYLAAQLSVLPFELKHYLLFFVCEDPANKKKEFFTHSRMFIIDPETLKKFTDPEFVENCRVENPIHQIRIATLYKIAQQYFEGSLIESKWPTELELPLRHDYHPRNSI